MTKIILIDGTEQTTRLFRQLPLPDGFQIHEGDPSPEKMRGLIADAQVVLNGHTYMTAEDLSHAPRLKQIIFLGSGASSYIDLDAAQQRGIRVDTIRGYGDQTVAQHTIALALAALRQIVPMDRAIRDGIWEPLPGREFDELTFGIVGLGGIGRATAQLASALGFQVIAWNRSDISDPPCPIVSLDEVIERANILSLHLALTPETTGLLDAKAIARMPDQAILVNTSRAGLVRTDDMLDALKSGKLAHAALDVFDTEPLPADARVLDLPNVTVTSHAAYKTEAATRRLVARALELLPKGLPD